MKRILTSINKVILITLILLLSSCYYDQVEEVLPDDAVVSFAFDIQPIFTNNCISCHPILEPSPNLTEGNSYSSIVNDYYITPENLEESLLYQRLLGNPSIMPSNGALPTAEITLMKKWIEQGALNN